jgi:hypothetical protein
LVEGDELAVRDGAEKLNLIGEVMIFDQGDELLMIGGVGKRADDEISESRVSFKKGDSGGDGDVIALAVFDGADGEDERLAEGRVRGREFLGVDAVGNDGDGEVGGMRGDLIFGEATDGDDAAGLAIAVEIKVIKREGTEELVDGEGAVGGEKGRFRGCF